MGLEPSSGKLLWRYEKSGKGSPAVIITPLVSDGMIYSGAFRATTALIKPMRKDDGASRWKRSIPTASCRSDSAAW